MNNLLLHKIQTKTRLSDPYKPITSEQDRIYPVQDLISYENHLVAILDAKTDVQYNFKLSNDKVSTFRSERELHEFKIAGKI